ncbi:hypothetical protein AVEN_262850-1 [Araneus ventricosus]|uniref:RNase H type-1 domain-containing protein n=1 Tax=Araneus ventricosus TaxID=182803 RepID=A0A4Y2HKS0_ARAVE|nr:hypothetical protein AVEN_262850-1 [Araneus ventricosus]
MMVVALHRGPAFTQKLQDRKKCRDSILRLVRTKQSPQMVGKTARTQYSIPDGTVGPLKHATDHATNLPYQPITLLVENQVSVQATANLRSINTTSGEICKSLITNKYIYISWIKVHVGYDGNEEADILAKGAEESDRDKLSVKAVISFLVKLRSPS